MQVLTAQKRLGIRSRMTAVTEDSELVAAASHTLIEHILRGGERSELLELANRVRTAPLSANLQLALLGALTVEAEVRPPPSAETAERIAQAAETLCDGPLPVGYRRVGSAALVVAGSILDIERRGPRLLRAARQAQSLEDHVLATFAAQAALQHEDQLSPVEAALALAVIGVTSNRSAELEEAQRRARLLSQELPVVRMILGLRPARLPATEPDEISRAAGEFGGGDLKAAAARLRVVIGPHLEHGDDLLFGLHDVLAAVESDPVDAPACRSGLRRMIGHLRLLQGNHIVPRPARSGIRLAGMILARDPSAEVAELLVEFFEAAADSGFSTMVGREPVPAEGASPLEVASRLGLTAASAGAYPTRQSLWRAMDGRHALYVQLADYADGREEAISVHLTPGGRASIDHRSLSRAARKARRDLLTGSYYRVIRIERQAIDHLGAALIPPSLREQLGTEGFPGLVVVPDRGFWGVPWAALPVGEGRELGELTTISVIPSLSLMGKLSPRPAGSPLVVVSAIDGRIGPVPDWRKLSIPSRWSNIARSAIPARSPMFSWPTATAAATGTTLPSMPAAP